MSYVIGLCCLCGKEMYEGEDVYNVDDEKWCSSCAEGCCYISSNEEESDEVK